MDGKEKTNKTSRREPRAAGDTQWEEAGEPRGLASSDGVWGEPVGLCLAASRGGTSSYRVNPPAIGAWTCLPWTEQRRKPWEYMAKASVSGVKH